MKYKSILKNGLIIFLPLILGGICSILINTKEYQSFNKPPLSPPGIVFPIVWSVLYLLIGISFYLAKKGNSNDKIDLIYYLGLAFNLIWPFIFFNFKFYFIGAMWIVLIIIFLVRLMILYFKVNKIAVYLQIPYLLWLCFALYLNIGVYILNWCKKNSIFFNAILSYPSKRITTPSSKRRILYF